jgi:hypothetical protein
VKNLHDDGGPGGSVFDLMDRKIPQDHGLNEEDDTEKMDDKDLA